MASSSYSQRHERRRRQRRSTASTVATTAATAAVAYGTYRLAQWYWKEDDESEEGIEHPLEEDLPSSLADEERTGNDNEHRNEDKRSSNCRPDNGHGNNFSWWSTAAVGVASWLGDAGTGSSISPGYRDNNNDSATRVSSARSRPQLTRRQQLIRCRCQSRVAFQTCVQTLKPAIEGLTDSSRKTKQLKILRRRRQELKQRGDQGQLENGCTADEKKQEQLDNGCTADEKEQERELLLLKEQEEELWREILVETTTRMMVSSYAYALLLLSLTVQFHWLASNSEFHQNSSEERQREQESLLMRSHRYFLNEGIPLLVSTVRRAVEKVLFGDDEIDEDENTNKDNLSSRWRNPSSQFVSSEDVERTLYHELPRVLNDIGMCGRQRRRRRKRNWIRFVLPDEEVFDPVWDICRSPVWEDAQEQVLGYLWYRVLRDGESNNNRNDSDSSHGWGKVFRPNGSVEGAHSDDNGEGEHPKQQQQKQPLAKVLAQFKKASSALFEETTIAEGDDQASGFRGETRSSMMERLQTLPMVLELGDITLE